MDKIPFEDGTKIKNATVTVNEQEYEVTPAQYQGKVPLSAFNLNKMQDNIENTLVKVSATEPENKADVWIKHSKNLFNGEIQENYGYNSNTGALEINNTTYADKNKIEVEAGKTIFLSKDGIIITARYFFYDSNNAFISSALGSDTYVTIPENAKYMHFHFGKTVVNNSPINLKIEYGTEPVEDDILVNDNGVYNSVLDRKNAISLGIKTQVNITQQGLRTLVPMDNLSVKVGETFELLSDGTIKILKNTIIFAFAQTQLIINDTDTGRLYIEKNGDGICAEEGKGTKAYQAMGIFNVNVGDIIRVTVVNVTAGRGNTGTTVSFNHLDMYEI